MVSHILKCISKNDIKGYPLKRWIVQPKHHVRDKIGFKSSNRLSMKTHKTSDNLLFYQDNFRLSGKKI